MSSTRMHTEHAEAEKDLVTNTNLPKIYLTDMSYVQCTPKLAHCMHCHMNSDEGSHACKVSVRRKKPMLPNY